MELHTVEAAIAALKKGEIIIVVDDEDREHEGDFVCAAQFAQPETINFMATYGKGLICLPMSQNLANQLQLSPMVTSNTEYHQTAFSISIDHCETSTGISAYDRALTARMCTQDGIQPEDFRRPGHMFPLIAKQYGVLERNGHTEASVDLLRLAGLKACGICCEIMKDDGSMMRTQDLYTFANSHQMPCITIQQLQEYRILHETFVHCTAITNMPTKYGIFQAHCYINNITKEHHIALVMGDVKHKENILCRVHSECLTGDSFGSLRCDCGEQLAKALTLIAQQKQGVLLYMRQEGRGIGLVNKLKAYALQDQGLDTLDANLALDLQADARSYEIASQILRDLQIQSIQLITNNPDKVKQITKYGMPITKRIPSLTTVQPHDYHYLKTKQVRMGHILHIQEEETL